MCQNKKLIIRMVGGVVVPLILLIIILAVTIPRGVKSVDKNEEADADVRVPTTRKPKVKKNDSYVDDSLEVFNACTYKDAKICTTCKRTAEYILNNMDLTQKPCDDFYKYVCGRAGESPWNVVRNNFEKEIEYLLTNQTKESSLKTATLFYNSCKNTKEIKSGGYYTVLALVDNPAQLPRTAHYLRNDEPDSFRWLESAGRVKRYFDIDIFFTFKVESVEDKYESLINTDFFKSTLRQDSSELGKVILTFTKEDILSKIEKIITVLPNKPDNETIENATKIINGLRNDLQSLLKQTTTKKDLNYGCTHYIDFIIDLKTKTGIDVNNDWENFFDEIFKGLSVEYKNNHICCTQDTSNYLKELTKWISKQKLVNLQLYVWYVTVVNLFAFSDVLDPNLDHPNRNHECLLITVDYLGMMLVPHIRNKNKKTERIEEILKQIDHSFETKIGNAKWIDSKAKSFIKTKTSLRTFIIGYPEIFFNDEIISDYYQQLNLKRDFDFIKNFYVVIQHKNEQSFKRLGTNYNKSQETLPFQVNAIGNYDIKNNRIVITDGMTNFPMFFDENSTATNVLNFGIMGSILARQVIAGFTPKSMNYDEEGNAKHGLWSDSFLKKFNEKKECFIKLYHKYEDSSGIFIRGEGSKTIDENIIDNAALVHAYLGFKEHSKRGGCDDALPGLTDFTDDQLFFIAYVNSFCAAQDSPHDYFQLPLKVRALKTLQNSLRFQYIFQCPEKTKMNPPIQEKCDIW